MGRNLSICPETLETRANTALRAGQVVCQSVPYPATSVPRALPLHIDPHEAAVSLTRHRETAGGDAQALKALGERLAGDGVG